MREDMAMKKHRGKKFLLPVIILMALIGIVLNHYAHIVSLFYRDVRVRIYKTFQAKTRASSSPFTAYFLEYQTDENGNRRLSSKQIYARRGDGSWAHVNQSFYYTKADGNDLRIDRVYTRREIFFMDGRIAEVDDQEKTVSLRNMSNEEVSFYITQRVIEQTMDTSSSCVEASLGQAKDDFEYDLTHGFITVKTRRHIGNHCSEDSWRVPQLGCLALKRYLFCNPPGPAPVREVETIHLGEPDASYFEIQPFYQKVMRE